MGRFRWPSNIAVAVTGLAPLMRISRGTVMNIGGRSIQSACAAWLRQDDEWSVWASPENNYYRDVWQRAVREIWNEDAASRSSRARRESPGPSLTEASDVDHIFPRSWALEHGGVALIRLFPVYAEVNRSAGAGAEKARLAAARARTADLPAPINGVWYAGPLQVQKILGLSS